MASKTVLMSYPAAKSAANVGSVDVVEATLAQLLDSVSSGNRSRPCPEFEAEPALAAY